MKRVSAWGSFARNWARGRDGGPVALAVAAALAGLSFALTVAAPQLGDAPLFLLVVPLALCASAYGLVGGTGFGLVASALAALWWLLNEEAGGYAWFASRAGACLAIGILLGWLTQTREALARQLQDHSELSLDLIATAGFDGCFRKVNPAFTRTLGHSEQELLAVPFLDFVHDEDRDSTIAAAAAQTEDGNPVISFQNRYRTKTEATAGSNGHRGPTRKTRP